MKTPVLSARSFARHSEPHPRASGAEARARAAGAGRSSQRTGGPLLHADVGTLLLLRDAGAADTLPYRTIAAAGSCRARRRIFAARRRARRAVRPEERRVGKEGVSTCRSRWSRYH